MKIEKLRATQQEELEKMKHDYEEQTSTQRRVYELRLQQVQQEAAEKVAATERELESVRAAAVSRTEQLQREVQDAATRLEAVQTALAQATSIHAGRTEGEERLKEELEKLHGELGAALERKSATSKEVKRLEAEKMELEKGLAKTTAQVELLQEEKDKRAHKIAELEQQVASQSTQLTAVFEKYAIPATKIDAEFVGAQKSKLQLGLSSLEENLASSRKKIERMRQKKSELRAALAEAGKKYDAACEENRSLQRNLTDMSLKLDESMRNQKQDEDSENKQAAQMGNELSLMRTQSGLFQDRLQQEVARRCAVEDEKKQMEEDLADIRLKYLQQSAQLKFHARSTGSSTPPPVRTTARIHQTHRSTLDLMIEEEIDKRVADTNYQELKKLQQELDKSLEEADTLRGTLHERDYDLEQLRKKAEANPSPEAEQLLAKLKKTKRKLHKLKKQQSQQQSGTDAQPTH
eukprot:TRINITY_DN3560_c0_g1_i1.p1 TRINITY_DN3560_c0_g1~~TRINITY_DN3560_c0_g1_i1.p1  ORF type:complete len:539 (-),score=172.64 TRINITY_DN3560_c0_g1_i1:189-1580(-)